MPKSALLVDRSGIDLGQVNGLFDWSVSKRRIFAEVPAEGSEDATHQNPDTGEWMRYAVQVNRVGLVPSDGDQAYEFFTPSVAIHDYHETLVAPLVNLLGSGELVAVSAGLWSGGARGHVQIATPENIKVEGFETYPFIMASSSYDGSLASSWNEGDTLVVCANTFAIAREQGTRLRVKHTRNSLPRLREIGEALGVLTARAEQTKETIQALHGTTVSRSQFIKVLDIIEPLPDESATQMAVTRVQNRRDALENLYTYDVRVAPWAGTGLGVFQAFSTYSQHQSTIRKGTERWEKNLGEFLRGDLASHDRKVVDAIELVTA